MNFAISGWMKNSFIDYPNKICTTVFTSGCSFRCPFCHNGELVLKKNLEDVNIEEFFSFLEKRKGLIDAVCITGGEPLLMKDIIPFIKKVKEMGYLVKLDTNGYTNIETLEEIITSKLVDYIAMDIKNSPSKYAMTAGLKEIDFEKIKRSVNLIRNSGIPYEFRTTISKSFHTKDDIMEIAKLLQGSEKYALQQYHYSNKQLEDKEFDKFSKEELLEIKAEIESFFGEVELRGIN